ncbi:MAG: hypothetical protein HY093_00925 [Candidatus Liptonbacteria bacterium]|nr:hypothetical protein [Candidatus Liptonbacteria bacterium]
MPWNNLKLQSHLKFAKLPDDIRRQSFLKFSTEAKLINSLSIQPEIC